MPVSFPSPAPKMRTSADSWKPEGAIKGRCCSASSAHGTARTEAQRMGLLACLATSNFKSSQRMRFWVPGSFRCPTPNMRTSADSWQPEGASLDSCCSASPAHGTARTEAQRMGLLACLATSNFKSSQRMVVFSQAPFAALLLKCECLQIAGSQKGLAWKAVAQPHLPMALFA